MTEYGVQTNNIFDLLNAADEAARPAAKPKARNTPKKGQSGGPAKKEQSGAKPAQQRPSTTTVTVSGGRGSVTRGAQAPAAAASPAGGRGGGRGGQQAPRQTLARGTPEFVRRHDDSHVSFAEEKGKADTHRSNEGAPTVKHNPPNRGREFDRHSGTGRSPTENKKGGAGSGNWGKNNADEELAALEDVKAEVAAESPEAKKDDKKKKNKKKKGKKGEEEEEKEKKDEIPDEQLKTLEDFMKERATKAVKLTLPPARAAGEGVKADPKWAEAVKREDTEEVFVKTKEEPKKVEPEEAKKPSKSSLRKKRKKEAKEQAAKKLAEENIVNMFDFSAKKENDFPRKDRRGPRPNREGEQRGPRREGGQRGPREGGQRGPKEGGRQRGPREGGRNPQQQPRKYKPGDAEGAPQFDASAFPALQVGPPPITVD